MVRKNKTRYFYIIYSFTNSTACIILQVKITSFFIFYDFSLLADDDVGLHVDISFDCFFLGVHSSNFIHHLLMFFHKFSRQGLQ